MLIHSYFAISFLNIFHSFSRHNILVPFFPRLMGRIGFHIADILFYRLVIYSLPSSHLNACYIPFRCIVTILGNCLILVNITNISYLYTKNPKIYKNVKIIKKTDWKTMQKIVGEKWDPGMNVPFDPVAVKKAAKLKLKLILLGKDLKSFDDFLKKKKFKGSIVE